MRKIQKANPPAKLMAWINANKNKVNYNFDSLNQDANVRQAVLKSLIKEQGGLCAYTGIKITSATCHIEHLLAQAHCKRRKLYEDVSYRNMAACVPRPNSSLPYGAQAKKSWPNPDIKAEAEKFISPLDADCERKFEFKYSGKVLPANDNEAATETIEHLQLDHPTLKRLRQSAIIAELNPDGRDLPIAHIKRRLAHLEAQTGEFDEFCFVLKQVLRRHIATREAGEK